MFIISSLCHEAIFKERFYRISKKKCDDKFNQLWIQLKYSVHCYHWNETNCSKFQIKTTLLHHVIFPTSGDAATDFNVYVSRNWCQPFGTRVLHLNFSTPVCKMWIIQEPKKGSIMKKTAFWRKKRRVCSMFKILSIYSCWKKYIKCNIWRVAVRPSYIKDARFLKVKQKTVLTPSWDSTCFWWAVANVLIMFSVINLLAPEFYI